MPTSRAAMRCSSASSPPPRRAICPRSRRCWPRMRSSTPTAAARSPRRAGGEPLARPHDDLAAARLAPVEHLRDRRVVVVEHLAQQERGALGGRQPLEQHQERLRQRVGHLDLVRDVADQRLGQPRADVRLAPDPRAAQHVEREARGHRRDPRRGLVGWVGPDQPHHRLLRDVLGLGHAAEHPVRHLEGSSPDYVNAFHTRAGVIGSSVRRAPVAPAIALAIAGGAATTGGSPTPLAPKGPSGAGTSTIRVSIGGT